MRIVIDGRKIADYGIGTYIRGLLRGLAELHGDGEDYVVLAPAGARDLIPFEHVIADAPHYSVSELFTVGRAVRRLRPDVFHAPHYVLPFTGVPSVVTIHDLIHLRMRHRRALAPVYARVMLRRAARASACVLAVSEAVRREIEAAYRIDNVLVTPNGIDERFRPEGRRAPGRYFLFVGNDKPHKNVDRLVDAYLEFAAAAAADESAGEPIDLVLAGAPFERFTGRATLAGFVDDDELAALYRGAVAVVVPSLDEGFGLPAAEAMASGTPVITSNAAALVEVTADAGLHVDARSTRAIAEAMRRVSADAALRSEMSARGLERARSFTWRRCAELTRAAYREAASSQR